MTTLADLLKGTNTNWDGSDMASGFGGGNLVEGKTGHNIDIIYQNLVGRNADPSGKAYWKRKIDSGQNDLGTLVNTLKANKEFKDQQTYLSTNPNASADQLKSIASAHVSPFHSGSGSAVAGYDPWKYGITQEMADAITTDPNVEGSNYSDQTNKTVADIIAANKDKEDVDKFAEIGGVGKGTPDPTVNPVVPPTFTGLTTADLDEWWKNLDKPWLNQDTNTGGGDDFMKLMMFMAMMRPGGFGGGGGHYGYGVSPGGVQSAYNPLANLGSYMNAFKNLPGMTSNSLNVTGT